MQTKTKQPFPPALMTREALAQFRVDHNIATDEDRAMVAKTNKPAAECRSDADALLLASQSSRIAELEAALERMCTLFEQEGPRDAHEWAGAKAARALLAKMEGR